MDKELKDLLEEQNKAFDEFKKSNDELLKAKAEGKAVSELEAKVGSAEAEIARLSKELDEVAKKANRPGAAGNDEKAHIEAEHKAGWLKWIRKGDDAGLSGLEAKAISVGTQADGGYAVPVEQDREILRLLREQSPMRQVCRVVTIGTEDFRKLVNLGGTASGWVGEKAARSETATAKFAELKPVFGEIYANPADDLVDLIYALKKGHRTGAQWMMNGKTLSVIRKWKDTDGNYLWQPGLLAGQPSQILGYGIVENEDMPDVGANATPVLFGNYARAYWIFDRIGIRSLRDPFTNKPYVHFYTTKRVGGMLVDSEAVKILKCAAA